MLQQYRLEDTSLDSLDLKALLITQGVAVHPEVYQRCGGNFRLSPDPMQCNTLILPDGTAAHLVDLGQRAPFGLQLDSRGHLVLLHHKQLVSEVRLPRASGFYRQNSSSGTPFRGLGVLEGTDVVAFPDLWPCQYPQVNATCKFCHCGQFTELQTKSSAKPSLRFHPSLCFGGQAGAAAGRRRTSNNLSPVRARPDGRFVQLAPPIK